MILQKIKQNKEIYYSILLIVIPLILFFTAIFVSKSDIDDFASDRQTITDLAAETAQINTFAGVKIKGKSAIVKDLKTGEILYAKNETVPLPLASITKVLTALTVATNSSTNVVGISEKALETEGESQLFSGEKFYKKDLINLTLISSSNDGAAALAIDTFSVAKDPQDEFIKEMNVLAQKIGMKDSYFYNETGLDNDEVTAGAHGSAKDVAIMFEYALSKHPEIIEFTKEGTLYIKSINGLIHTAQNTNEIVGSLPNTIASKTGFTDIAGGNLAVIIDPTLNNPVAIVVLGSTEQGRFEDVEKLASKTTDFFRVNYNSGI
jgi:D-alanyl-D-alanine carboxypeptidase (penicillin-binding protein 5/6)